ncbi:MAG: DeoR family transcriptional regulator [Phycisphaerales bacterium]|nr:DeoR family transcriptional regulator [Phycisphaerales bacterium]
MISRATGWDPQRAATLGDSSGVTSVVPGDNDGVPGVNERQQWILDELRAGTDLRRGDIESRYKCSAKTAKRDLAELRERGLIEFVAKPAPGHYRLLCPVSG